MRDLMAELKELCLHCIVHVWEERATHGGVDGTAAKACSQLPVQEAAN
ncbi:hypothetical protein ACVWVZ_000128 [Pseudomonas tolaasii]